MGCNMKTAAKGKKVSSPAPINQLEVLDNRHKLRIYCAQNNIKTPDYFASEQFAPISLWAMKKNTFPLCIKTSANLNHNQLIYVLKAFRELPEFFETIQAKNNKGEVLIEEFVEGKARLEVTYFNGKIRLISQVSLSQAMKVQTKWRGFPITLPDSIYKKITEIISVFNQITETTEEPIRFSFVIKNSEPILISINKDNNRLEYHDSWRNQADLENLSEASYPSKTKRISKINIYRGIKNPNIDFSKIESVCEKCKIKWTIVGTRLNIMLSSNSPKDLAEDFEKVDAIAKQIIEASIES